MAKFLERLFFSKNPERRKTPYTWLGKRVLGVTEILDGIYNFFTPKNTYSRLSFDFVFWSAKTTIGKRKHE